MSTLVNPAILLELRSLYPYLELKPLSGQQETLIRLLLQGASLTAASRGAGYSTTGNARTFLETEPAQAIMKYFAEQEIDTIRVTRDKITQMYLELYGERGNTNEGARVLEGLARLHGLNEEAKQKKVEINNTTVHQNNTQINNNLDAETVRKKMEVMDDKALIEQAGPRFASLDLEPKAINRDDDHALIDMQRERPDEVLVKRETETASGSEGCFIPADSDSGRGE